MDAQIAPASVRPAEDGPGYDLVSLGLVLFTLLLIGVWTPYFFRQPPADLDEFERLAARADLKTSAGHLQLARWADFNLRSADSADVSIVFRDHLREALALEAAERDALEQQVRNLREDQSVAARAELAEHPVGEAELYARQWYANRAAWLDARDARAFNVGAHVDFAIVLREIGRDREAQIEQEKVQRARPGWPGQGTTDEGLPVIREHGTTEGQK